MSQQSIHDRIMFRDLGKTPDTKPAQSGRPRRGRLKRAAVVLLGAVVVAAGGYAVTRFNVLQDFTPAAAIAKTAQTTPNPPDTPFLQHTKQAGLQACSGVFPVLGQLLTSGAQYSIQSSWNNQTPDKHAVQALVGMDYATADYNASAAGIVFAAPTGSACEGAMVRVAPYARPCADIPSLLEQGSKLVNTLGKVMVYELAGNRGNAMLVPTGDSCVVVSVAQAAQ